MFEQLSQLASVNPFVQGGVTLMFAGWLGYQLRSLPGVAADAVRTYATRVVQVREGHPHYDAWLSYLTDHAVRRGGPRTLEVRVHRDRDGETVAPDALAAGTDSFWARVLGVWARVVVHMEQGAPRAQTLAPKYMITAELWLCPRDRLAAMVAQVVARANRPEPRQPVDLYDRYGSRTTIRIPKRDPATLCLPAGLFESLEARVREFCGAREQYEHAGVPWRLGVLLSGPPGTGKTSTAHALASRLGLRIAVLPLADLQSDQEMVDVFRSVGEQAVVLLEDIDCAFRHREAGGDAAGVSFSGLLNCIDGVLAPHNGRVLVMTTNHPERLDPALVRPGRVDVHVRVPLLDARAAAEYADRVFPSVATRHELVAQVLASDSPTPAALISRLGQHRWRRGQRLETNDERWRTVHDHA